MARHRLRSLRADAGSVAEHAETPALGVLVPRALVGGLEWLAFAAARRRRREAALG